MALDSELRWYVVHTFSGYENRVKSALEDRVEKNGLEEQIAQVLLPMETPLETVAKTGGRRPSARKLFPGYILVRMLLNDVTWHLIKETPKVTGFLGDKNTPEPISEEEAERILNQIKEGPQRSTPQYHFDEGDEIKVVDGPFNNFNGVVEEVNEDKSKLKVLINIFGRPTPVELDFHQVARA